MTNGPGAWTNLPNGHEINGDFIKIREKFYRLGAPEAGPLLLTSLRLAPFFLANLSINLNWSLRVNYYVNTPTEIICFAEKWKTK